MGYEVNAGWWWVIGLFVWIVFAWAILVFNRNASRGRKADDEMEDGPYEK